MLIKLWHVSTTNKWVLFLREIACVVFGHLQDGPLINHAGRAMYSSRRIFKSLGNHKLTLVDRCC